MPKQKELLTTYDQIINAKSFRDLILISLDELIKDKNIKEPEDIFTFPVYPKEIANTNNSSNLSIAKTITNECIEGANVCGAQTKGTKDENSNLNVSYKLKEADKLKTLINIVDKEKNVCFNEDELIDILNKKYKNELFVYEKPKYSVSEIKKTVASEDSIQKLDAIDITTQDDALIEENRSNIERVDGTVLGNLFHSFLEHYDFETNVKDFIEKDNIGKKFEALNDYIDKINTFLSSDLANNIKKAKKENKLFREQRFMIEVPLSNIKSYLNENNNDFKDVSSPLIIVQGVIDLFYIDDDDNIILLDYKTDGILNGNIIEDDFIKKYEIQLEIYEKALYQLTRKKVKQKHIYSFALNKDILL